MVKVWQSLNEMSVNVTSVEMNGFHGAMNYLCVVENVNPLIGISRETWLKSIAMIIYLRLVLF